MGLVMIDRRVLNGLIAALVILFVVQSGVDIVSVEYEVPGPMYGIVSVIVTAAAAAAFGINAGRDKNGNGNGESKSDRRKKENSDRG